MGTNRRSQLPTTVGPPSDLGHSNGAEDPVGGFPIYEVEVASTPLKAGGEAAFCQFFVDVFEGHLNSWLPVLLPAVRTRGSNQRNRSRDIHAACARALLSVHTDHTGQSSVW